ncbi:MULTISPECIES: hypothetical protein [unclassified Streptomyces]|uniref:hypothetical protein n=1 Tax=unclassified Streptomyces TaxID=2593676 RepID=UPI000DAC649C|nr:MULTISPECIES: hypothetical protein [unclassified Streptomyces]PZT78156.1 hypothetical protein DNK56_31870 [Streptomyces sp. AC1-42W]PZT78309.1 hypothetical protein DNK55_00820 [Streptomyces sp. AC1-42T]
MSRLSAGAKGLRGTGAPAALAWLFILVALAACCSPQSGRHHPGPEPRVWSAAAPADFSGVRAVVADSPGGRGVGDSCRGTSEHTAPVLLPGQPAPAGVPSAAVATLPAQPLTGGRSIRGPSNDAVGEVDPLRLQVQRI